MARLIKSLFLAAEAEPFIKVGGLADVAGTLPIALRALPKEGMGGASLDVRLVLPLHKTSRIDTLTKTLVARFPIEREGSQIEASVYECLWRDMPVYFIDGEPITKASTVYTSDPAEDREKFAFFSIAALEMLHHIGWQPELIHANDWHTTFALYALRSKQSDPILKRLKSLLTLHNLPFMGGDATDVLHAYGLTASSDDRLPHWARSQPLPLGLLSANAIIPVSPTYAREILTPEFGCGLESFLHDRIGDINGILNGLDTASFDPETDRALSVNFGSDSIDKRKANKEALQTILDLQVNPSLPLLAMVGRIDQQKGVDLALKVIGALGGRPYQFVILGSGDTTLETMARELQSTHPDRVRTVLRYDAQLGRMIYGGADMFLMPSRYEPCGLAQMIAMRYGCIPIVRSTGGLKDTVHEGRTGFLFQEATTEALADALERAFTSYQNQETWRFFQKQCMLEDFSWSHSARLYATLYQSILNS